MATWADLGPDGRRVRGYVGSTAVEALTVGQVVAELAADPPNFHRDGNGHDVSFHVGSDVLALLADVVTRGATTLETGAGASTVVFLAAGAVHTAISPAAHEPERIRAWCQSHSVDTSGYTHLLGSSTGILPTLESAPLDVVLVDGDHAFPTPSLDWYYATRHLRAGGVVILDDLQLWPCSIVADFLGDEEGWERIARTGRHAVFRATRPGIELTSRWWGEQGHVMRHFRLPMAARLRGVLGKVSRSVRG